MLGGSSLIWADRTTDCRRGITQSIIQSPHSHNKAKAALFMILLQTKYVLVGLICSFWKEK